MKLYDSLNQEFRDWITRQPMFFVASAPLTAEGHINLSPRGYDSLRILDEHTVAWLDLTGSGNETAAHVQENGRLTIMFCAFEDPPRILRLYGRGEVILPDSSEWPLLSPLFPELPGARQIFRLAIERIQTSCGYGVPLMSFNGERERLLDWADRKGESGLEDYRQRNNRRSIDGLPVKLESS